MTAPKCSEQEFIDLFKTLGAKRTAERLGTTTANTQHNAEFHRIADRVCAIHGFDRKAFI